MWDKASVFKEETDRGCLKSGDGPSGEGLPEGATSLKSPVDALSFGRSVHTPFTVIRGKRNLLPL